MPLTQPILPFQIHSLTARSVPRHFREDLKKGMPTTADKNIKVTGNVTKVTGKVTPHNPTTPTTSFGPAKVSQQPKRDLNPVRSVSGSSLHIVYDSENKDLVPYPEGEIIRTPSPDVTGVPVRRPHNSLNVPSRATKGTSKVNGGRREEPYYTSDESNSSGFDLGLKPLPPALRRKAKKSNTSEA